MGEIVWIARLVFEHLTTPGEHVSPPIVSFGGRANEERLTLPCEVRLLSIRTIVTEQRVNLERRLSDRRQRASDEHTRAVPDAIRDRTNMVLLTAVMDDVKLVKQRDRR